MASFKRGADEDYARPCKRSRAYAQEATARHDAHPDSGIGQNFHRVPYPLSLLPLKTWTALHNNTDGAVCSQCRKPRSLNAHQRKMFLVAERLSWDRKCLSTAARVHNEEMLWAVNAELGIMEPVLHDETDTLGGRISRGNEWFPWANEAEACVAMHLLHRTINVSEESFQVWRKTVEDGLRASREAQLAEGDPSSSIHRVPLTEMPLNRVESVSRHRLHSHPPPDPVFSMLATRASSDPVLKAVMRDVARGNATPEQLRIFRQQIVELTQVFAHQERTGESQANFPVPTSSTMPPGTAIPGQQTRPTPSSEHGAGEPASYLLTPPSSSENHAQLVSKDSTIGTSQAPPSVDTPISIKHLTELYQKLDKIERTSPMAAMYLETYAERQVDEVCSLCWLKLHILTDEELEEAEHLLGRPKWTRGKPKVFAESSFIRPYEGPCLSKAVLDSLAKLDAREQTAEWLRRCYKADPAAQTCLLPLMTAHIQALKGCKGGAQFIKQADFVEVVDELWPHVRREPTASGQVFIGISPREQPVDIVHVADVPGQEEEGEASEDA